VRSPEFLHEDACLGFLDELRGRWTGRVQHGIDVRGTEREIIAHPLMLYRRVGYDERVLELLPSHRIGVGHAACESVWYVTEQRGELALVLASQTAVTCALRRSPDGAWRGRWIVHERMPVELLPYGGESPLVAGGRRREGSTAS
jgi:hypothetical protein